MKILLVDDHRMFLKGLRLMLEQAPPLSGAGRSDGEASRAELEIEEAATGAVALERAVQFKPDLVVMDLHLPDGDGIEVSRQILARVPGVRIIVLTGEAGLSYVNRALQAGVSAYLQKESTPDELPRAIGAVMAGKLYVCPEANAAVLLDYKQALAAREVSTKPALSAREREVLCLIADGCRTKEIAEKLQIGVKTAETYRRRVLRKLGCTGTAELVRYAIREGIVSG